MDKVMKRLGIEVAELSGKDVTPIVYCNSKGRLVGDGMNSWLTALRSYALKLNPTIDGIQHQPLKELEAIKEVLEMGFEDLDHPFAFKYVKDQVVIVLKGRQRFLKKRIKKGKSRP
jgi:hypothetical protein